MKKLILSSLTTLLLAMPVVAQSNAPTLGNTLSQVGTWAGTINTNYHYQAVMVWDGPIYANQVNVANELGGSFDFYTSSANRMADTNGFTLAAVEARSRQAGIAGTFVSEQGGLQFGYEKCDFRAVVYLDYVNNAHPENLGSTKRNTFEGGLMVDKMLSASSAVGVFAAWQRGIKYPIIGAQLNVSWGGGTGLFGLFGAKGN